MDGAVCVIGNAENSPTCIVVINVIDQDDIDRLFVCLHMGSLRAGRNAGLFFRDAASGDGGCSGRQKQKSQIFSVFLHNNSPNLIVLSL